MGLIGRLLCGPLCDCMEDVIVGNDDDSDDYNSKPL